MQTRLITPSDDDDLNAANLAVLLAWYADLSVKEGATLDEIAGWTIEELAADIKQTHPDYLPALPARITELAKEA